MDEKEIIEFQKEIIETIIPFEKMPPEIKGIMSESVVLRHELSKESDRGCALLSTAHLDFLLENVLRKKLIGSKNHLDSIFNFNGPVGTFSGRILLCYSIGLLTKMQLHDIQILRKIRNDFGHSPSIISFEHDKIKSLCMQLKLIGRENCEKPRSRFIASTFLIMGSLDVMIINEDKFQEKRDFNIEEIKKRINVMLDYIHTLLKEES